MPRLPRKRLIPAAQISRLVLRDRTQDLPPEIMAIVFSLLCERVLIPIRKHAFPWVIGRVCSRWRRILWDRPPLWNKITIYYQNPVIHKYQVGNSTSGRFAVGDVLDYILSNVSGPISLTVLNHVAEYPRGIAEIILKHSNRLVELAVCGPQQDAVSAILDLPTGVFSQLETLSLPDLSIDEHFLERTTSSLQTAPKLRRVTYTVYSTYTPSLLLLPWDTIQHISVMGTMCIPPRMILHIFESCPSLTSCAFLLDDEPSIFDISGIILPAVEALEFHTRFDVDSDVDFDWDTLLSRITTPSLKSLTIRSAEFPYASLASLVTRSHCSIENLRIVATSRRGYDEHIDISLFLDYFPSLTNLEVPWSFPASLFGYIHAGAFPMLSEAVVVLGPDGLGALLDIADSYVDSPQAQGWSGILAVTIALRDGPGSAAQQYRYEINLEAYDSAGGLRLDVLTLDEWISWNDE